MVSGILKDSLSQGTDITQDSVSLSAHSFPQSTSTFSLKQIFSIKNECKREVSTYEWIYSYLCMGLMYHVGDFF
jgi:hypothetical protein